MAASNAVFEHHSRNDPFYGINNCIKHCLVDIVATDNQGDGPAWNRVHNRSKTPLMTVHDQIRMRFRNDGYTADIVYHLNQSADATAFIEPLIGKALLFNSSRSSCPRPSRIIQIGCLSSVSALMLSCE